MGRAARAHAIVAGAFAGVVAIGSGGCGAIARPPEPVVPVVASTARVAPPSAADLSTGDAQLLAGTGVAMVPPPGATRMRFGTGWVASAAPLDVYVAVSDEPSSMDTLASFGSDGVALETTAVAIDGHRTELVVDRTFDRGQEIERAWFVMREGSRSLAVLGEYPADEAPVLRAAVRASLLSTRWDAHASLDPERAGGYRLAAPEGLVPVPEVVNGITYTVPRTRADVSSGAPTLVVTPLGLDVPSHERESRCEAMLLAVGPVPIDGVVERGAFAGEVLGCELVGREDVRAAGGPSVALATYGALVFLEDEAFLVVGAVSATGADAWLPRFAAAARGLGVVARGSSDTWIRDRDS